MTRTRREFLQNATLGASAVVAAGRVGMATAGQTPVPPLRSRIGLQLYTVRDRYPTDFAGTLAKVAEIGYSEVEATSYNNMSPRDFRALLDGLQLVMPSTHAAVRGTDTERELEALQIMGIRYATSIRPGAAPAADPRRPATIPPGGYFDAGSGRVRNSFRESEAFGPYRPPVSLEQIKRRAASLNADGKVAAKFGIKMAIHNHTDEFMPLTDSPKTSYDVLLEETDPERVVMELDLGWAHIAGFDPVDLFKAHPGRFELWHVKDVFGLKTVDQSLSPDARVSSMALVPVGTGQIDFKPIFASATLAGMRHFFVEQDTAAVWGDSLAAARVSYQNLAEALSMIP